MRLRGGEHQLSTGFEAAEKAFIAEALLQADRFVDVGANIGLYAVGAARGGCPVVAVEPSPENASLLMENLVLNRVDKDVVVLPLALGSTEGGTLPLYNEGTGASLISGWAGTPPTFVRYVPVATLDAVIGGWAIEGERLLIKVDVEGAELNLFIGATATLTRTPRPVWMVEINFEAHHPGGRHPAFGEVFKQFWQYGYICEDIESGKDISASDVEQWLTNGVQSFGRGGNYCFRSDRATDANST